MALRTIVEHIASHRGRPDVVAFGSGVVLGVLHGNDVDAEPEWMQYAISGVPLAYQATAGAHTGLVKAVSEHESKSAHVAGGMAKGTAIGAVEQGLGYCVGYTLSSLL